MKSIIFSLTLFVFSAPFISSSAALTSADYFPQNFSDSRAKWNSAIKALTQPKTVDFLKIPSRTESDMFIDYAYFPAKQNSTHLVVISSGVHGVEAFAGDAIILQFLRESMESLPNTHTSYLIIYNVNPWGFKKLRRVTENNIDLNRNFDINDQLFKESNDGYQKVTHLLNPEKPVHLANFDYFFSFAEMLWQIVKYSMKPLRQAILQGQYQFPKGLYFGGKDFEDQNLIIGRLFKKYAKNQENILMVDIHTGYGQRGKLHLFGASTLTRQQRKLLNQVFPNQKIDTGEDQDFYSVHGDFSDFLGKIAPENSTYLPITFEFGTLDSQTYEGALKSINTMIRENQGHFYGYKRPQDRGKVQKMMEEMYYPTDPKWRAQVLQAAKTTLDESIRLFSTP